MTFDEIVSRFTVKSRKTGSVQCLCPAHRDKEASLTISQGKKGTVLHCHAGCDTAAVLEEVGLQIKDLYEDDNRAVEDRGRLQICRP